LWEEVVLERVEAVQLPENGDLYVAVDPPRGNGCPPDDDLAGGVAVAWVNDVERNVLTPAGTHEILRLFFAGVEGAKDACSPVRFSECLGVAEAPIRNVVTDENGRSVAVATADSAVCPFPLFVRGYANADETSDITDAVFTLGYLFLGGPEPPCLDSADTDDSGLLDITDAVYLLGFLFLGGPPPPPPFSTCGPDPTVDDLGCEHFPLCE
jgi:hypothetical protein